MKTDPKLTDEFEQFGRIWLHGAVSEQDLSLLDRAISLETKPGQRVKVDYASAPAFSPSSTLVQAVRTVDPHAKPVRTVGFNKSKGENWTLPWHQDRVIAVKNREDIAGFDNWTQKSGVWHCEPPIGLFDQMLFVRVHLDDTGKSNGAMRIALGSHKSGFVAAVDAAETARRYPEEICEAKRGDILILKMLTLHGSKPSAISSGRRVLRIDFASCDLPPPLEWN